LRLVDCETMLAGRSGPAEQGRARVCTGCAREGRQRQPALMDRPGCAVGWQRAVRRDETGREGRSETRNGEGVENVKGEKAKERGRSEKDR
jgi:hypothetical protein